MLAGGGGVLVGGVAFIRTRAQRYHDGHRRLFCVTFPSGVMPASALAALGAATGLDRPHQLEFGGVPSIAFETLGHLVGERPRKPRLPSDDVPLFHALAITELAVRLEEAKRAGLIGSVGLLPEFTGLSHMRPDALVGLLPPDGDLEKARRCFLEIELSRKDSGRLDEKLSAYTDAWRRSGWRRFPRVLLLAGSTSRFPSNARFIYRELERAVRRQPGDARHIFALATYDEAVRVLLGIDKPLILSADDGARGGETVDPIQLLLPVDLDAPQSDEPPDAPTGQ